MKTQIIAQDVWGKIKKQWEADAISFGDDLTYLPSIHADHGEILLVKDEDNYPVMVTNLVIAQLPGMNGDTLRSTKSAFAPKFEFDSVDDDQLVRMYASAVFFIYEHSVNKKCDNIKVYTPRASDMKQWHSILSVIADYEKIDRTVQYQGRWTALVKRTK